MGEGTAKPTPLPPLTVDIITLDGSISLIHDVQYVPCLAYNLLSVDQLLESGYSILFDDGSCIIHDKNTGQKPFTVQMTKDKTFPFDVSVKNKNCALVVQKGVVEYL